VRRARATHSSREKPSGVETFRRQPGKRPPADCAIDARLETTPASSERLLNALSTGTRDFVLTSTDGRLSARVRLTIANVALTEHQLGDATLVVDWAQSTIANGPRREAVSRTELRLLAALLDAAGGTVTRGALIEHIWPSDTRAMPERENSLAVYVCCVRKRLAAIGIRGSLRTVRRVGYQLLI
jgi:DNA-binding response OmpR family regulator